MESIRIDSYKHQKMVMTVLNDAAASNNPLFSALAIGKDDWTAWDELYSRTRASVRSGGRDPVQEYVCEYQYSSKNLPLTDRYWALSRLHKRSNV
jgi:hypothetical protein